jgi:hypothetical protein
MFSRSDMFPDKNEGIDRLLAQLEISGYTRALGMGWHDDETVRTHHEKVKKSHYISCWSQTAESIAMWSLYSPDYSAVRISTTISKLRSPLDALLSKYSFERLAASDLGNRVVVAVEGHIAPVQYTDLSWIARKVTRRVKAHRRLALRYTKQGKPLPQLNQIDPRFYEREQQRRLTDTKTTCRLKDISFQHEAEVRLSVRLGEEVCSPDMLKDRILLDPSHQYHMAMKDRLRAWGFVSSAPLPSREFAPYEGDLIDTVAIDPRCPDHKATFIRQWFMDHGIPVVESKSFGYLSDSFDVYPER